MQTLECKSVKVRKPHRCYGCNGDIAPGDTAKRITSVDGGEIYHTYWCQCCDEFVKDYNRQVDADNDSCTDRSLHRWKFWVDREDGINQGGMFDEDGYAEFAKEFKARKEQGA